MDSQLSASEVRAAGRRRAAHHAEPAGGAERRARGDARRAGDRVGRHQPRRPTPGWPSSPAPAGRSRQAATSAMVERQIGNYDLVTSMLSEMSDLVYNMANCEKPIVSAINGVAVGAGLVVALLADISICADRREARRRARPARRRGRRPRRHHLAAAVRPGQGEVLPADRRDGHRRGSRADRPGRPRRCPAMRCCPRRCGSPTTWPPARSWPSG